MAWVALKAVYMAHPRRIAKPATCSVRSNSLRRTCRNLARSGAAVTLGDYRSPAANTIHKVKSDRENATVWLGALPRHAGLVLHRRLERGDQVAEPGHRGHGTGSRSRLRHLHRRLQ